MRQFRSVSAKFKFVWDFNIPGRIDPATAYPGDEYVDVIGTDVYYDLRYDSSDPIEAFYSKVSKKYGLQWQQDFAARHGKVTSISEWGVNLNSAGPYIRNMAAWVKGKNVRFENYWGSNAAFAGALSKGQYPSAGKAFQRAFGPQDKGH